ncbi:hypothetical protein CWD77_03935 [Rhodohalobacter barkolensis]|uniref:Uncharacterized protein n=1 Tax=Rhodohalobacter barkolensis TaxID=2053187 RepID=A0A2N0VKC9_9BACT|nr:hypothetical protein CWD77_03935 [Rhodohalobacter barkolensis]
MTALDLQDPLLYDKKTSVKGSMSFDYKFCLSPVLCIFNKESFRGEIFQNSFLNGVVYQYRLYLVRTSLFVG